MKRTLFALLAAVIVFTGCTTGTEVQVLPTNTLAPLVTLTPRFTATLVVTRTPFPTFTFTPSITPIPPTPTNTYTPSPEPPVIGIITSMQTVNVRRGPGESFAAFVALTPGTGVTVLGENPEGTWLNIRMEDNQEGWISARLVRIEPTAAPFPSVTPSPDFTAQALGTPLQPTALIGGAATPTPLQAPPTATTQPTAAAAVPTSSPTNPPTATTAAATRNPNLPVIDLTAINATGTALAAGLPTTTPTTASAQATAPGTAGPPTITPAPGTATIQFGVDVLAECDNPFKGGRPNNLAAGSTIDIWWSWYARTRAQIDSHLNAVTYEVRLNGTLVENWRQYAIPVRLEDDGNYHIYWYVRTDPLPAGENRITYRATWSTSITDGYDSFGPGTGNAVLEGSCTFNVR